MSFCKKQKCTRYIGCRNLPPRDWCLIVYLTTYSVSDYRVSSTPSPLPTPLDTVARHSPAPPSVREDYKTWISSLTTWSFLTPTPSSFFPPDPKFIRCNKLLLQKKQEPLWKFNKTSWINGDTSIRLFCVIWHITTVNTRDRGKISKGDIGVWETKS